MESIKKLCLPNEDDRLFYYKDAILEDTIVELEEFLELDSDMNSMEFARKMLFSHELQYNNLVEGYGDDLSIIENVINRKVSKIKDLEQRKRIYNLYKGYQYILKTKRLNERALKQLYKILSKDLLIDSDIERMGELYRNDKVFILNNGRLDSDIEEGVSVENIEKLMNCYFEFIKKSDFSGSMTEEYIKSQIMHFYLVYIHPYFDVNGRTSRTMSMWYLLSKESIPYIIFNRGIRNSEYDKLIRDAKHRNDLTKFLEYMLDSVKVEFEKEYVMQSIADNTPYKLCSIDYQTLLNFLSMNGLKSLADFTYYYNRYNDKKRPKEVYEEMILPLIDMDIFKVERYTKKQVVSDLPNMVLELNKDKIDNDPRRIRRIKI